MYIIIWFSGSLGLGVVSTPEMDKTSGAVGTIASAELEVTVFAPYLAVAVAMFFTCPLETSVLVTV